MLVILKHHQRMIILYQRGHEQTKMIPVTNDPLVGPVSRSESRVGFDTTPDQSIHKCILLYNRMNVLAQGFFNKPKP